MSDTQPPTTVAVFLDRAKNYTDVGLETFAYLMAVDDGVGPLVVRGISFPVQKCTSSRVSVVGWEV